MDSEDAVDWWAIAKAQRTENERLRPILKECADELEAWVENYYAKTKDYPSEMRRYERDIEPVRRARLILEKQAP